MLALPPCHHLVVCRGNCPEGVAVWTFPPCDDCCWLWKIADRREGEFTWPLPPHIEPTDNQEVAQEQGAGRTLPLSFPKCSFNPWGSYRCWATATVLLISKTKVHDK